jgi:hypothetical protein
MTRQSQRNNAEQGRPKARQWSVVCLAVIGLGCAPAAPAGGTVSSQPAPSSASAGGAAPRAPAVRIAAPVPATALLYQACTASGHVRIETTAAPGAFALRPDPARTRPNVQRVTVNGAPWAFGESAWTGDMSQALTIDGRLRDELPAHWARSEAAPPVWLDVTGMRLDALRALIAGLNVEDGDGEPLRHHHIGDLHLHLPESAAFEAVWFDAGPERYGARLTRRSQWARGGTSAILAGVPFWWARTTTSTNDHTGLPATPAWHGEASIDGLILEVDAAGDQASDAKFVELATAAVTAALQGGAAPCRRRVGHMGQ